MTPGTGNCPIRNKIMAVKHVFPRSVDGSEHSLLRLVSLVGPMRRNVDFGTLAGWGTIGYVWLLASGHALHAILAQATMGFSECTTYAHFDCSAEIHKDVRSASAAYREPPIDSAFTVSIRLVYGSYYDIKRLVYGKHTARKLLEHG